MTAYLMTNCTRTLFFLLDRKVLQLLGGAPRAAAEVNEQSRKVETAYASFHSR
jgi:hypothetical protein